MSKTSLLAIFATAGLVFSGVVTPDSIAFAKAIQADDPMSLVRFATQNPDSVHRLDALRIAARVGCVVNWDNGDCGGPFVGGGGQAP
jgi:hypothetical protein